MVLKHRKLNVALLTAMAVLLISPALTFAAPGTFSLVSDADCKVICDKFEDCKVVCEENADCEVICEALEKGTITEVEALEACRKASSSEACEISCETASADCCPQQAKVQKVSATAASSCSASSGSTCVASAAARVAVRTSAKKDEGVSGPI